MALELREKFTLLHFYILDHGLPEETGLEAAFLMETLPFPAFSAAGESFTACPAKDGEERAIVEAAIA